jgi:hypothetical protein
MEKTHSFTSACRYCRYYQPEGRRGGSCQQLGVEVQGQWKACVLATPPFSTTWENLEEIVLLEHSLALDCAEDIVPVKIFNTERVFQVQESTNKSTQLP